MEDTETRRYQILFEVVEAYIDTGTPVGSQLIARRLRQRLSSATIRNVMHELESAGFLRQPHTSAGRVPTEAGYRVYVNQLRQQRQLREGRQAQRPALESSTGELKDLLGRACALLTEMTGQAAFALVPTVRQARVRQYHFVLVNPMQIVCTVIGEGNVLATHLVDLDEPLGEEELVAITRYLNAEVAGYGFDDSVEHLQRRLLSPGAMPYLITRALEVMGKVIALEPVNRLYIEGIGYIMAQPEFRDDPAAVEGLLRLLESQQELVACLQSDLASGGVLIRIGAELGHDALRSCSAIIAPFALGRRIFGGVGVLGPQRMNYLVANQAVESVSAGVTEVLNHWMAG